MHDVVIAGAGPVGLFLACELGLAGRSVLVLERAESPQAPLKGLPFGLRGLTLPTAEALDRRGLLDAIALPAGRAGHFAGIAIDDAQVDAAAWPYRLPGPAEAPLAAAVECIETVLAARADALGVEIRRGAGVDGVEQADGHVIVRAGTDILRACWLVGCDGGRSTVRKVGGFAMAGTEPEFTGYSLHVDLADPAALAPGRHATTAGFVVHSRPGIIALADFDGGAGHRAGPLTRERVQAVLRRVSGSDAIVTALHLAATWTDRALQATAYRNGRVLLAGDAAHIHAPLGGQGLNLGLGDAMNLGWKLAATLRGAAPAGLLDSYFGERHPVGAQVLDGSRAQVALMRPGPAERALAALVRDLAGTRDGATYFAGRVRGTCIRHDLGDDHPLVGRSVPDFAFADGTRVGTLLRDGRGLLLDFTGGPALQALGERARHALGYVDRVPAQDLGLAALLVRPDGIVAWASAAALPDAAAAARALSGFLAE